MPGNDDADDVSLAVCKTAGAEVWDVAGFFDDSIYAGSGLGGYPVCFLLITFDTVIILTPAFSAMSFKVIIVPPFSADVVSG